MAAKKSRWQIKGMNKDLAVSVFSPELAFECHNLRLSTNENNIQLCLVNEKGTGKITLEISPHPWKTDGITKKTLLEGTPVGTAMIDHQLVIFTTGEFEIDGLEGLQHIDRIYVLDSFENLNMKGRILYEGNLGFNVEYPLETLVSFEANHIKKVYWTDGFNQPRLINIAADESKLKVWNQHRLDEDSLIEPTPLDPSPLPYNKDTYFDFVPSINFIETNNPLISVQQSVSGNGTFAPGVIQYCFTLVNKYGQQTNVIDVTPLYYLVFSDRAASPDTEKVTCCFTITLQNLDTNYDYVRLYSIQRTSLNGDTIVKILSDIPISRESNKSLTYVDNGTTGSLIDPFELLYAGGKEIKALTMVDKDQTLFLGNITEDNEKVDAIQNAYRGYVSEYKSENEGASIITFDNLKKITLEEASGFYTYTNTLKEKNHREISTFKGGETYRFGFQLQKTTGEWSQPIWVDDATNGLYPNSKLYNKVVSLVEAKCNLPWLVDSTTNKPIIDTSIYKRIRPVIVYPNIQDRTVLCQGVLNPTVFSLYDRLSGYPFAQASWYFRPYMFDNLSVSYDTHTWSIKVDGRQKENTDTYSIDLNFTESGIYAYVYVVIGIGLSDAIKKVLKDGYIKFRNTNSNNVVKHSFDGAIRIRQYQQYDEYAFISYKDWHNDHDDNDTTAIDFDGTSSWKAYADSVIEDGQTITAAQDLYNYYIPQSTVAGVSQRFGFYTQLEITQDNLYKYTGTIHQHNGEDIYEYKFYVCDYNNFYTVIFTWGRDNEYGSSLTDPYSLGNPVAFKHYDPLASEEGDVTNLSTEIQGSDYRLVGFGETRRFTPYTAYTDLIQKYTNTQFFIDQSIVTLNSPDIDFDTEVQTWGTEDLTLKIVGAIPITSNVSSHSIAISSEMLPTRYPNSTYTTKDVETGEDIRMTTFGRGELDVNVKYMYPDNLAGNRLVAEYLWEDIAISKYKGTTENDKNEVETSDSLCNYVIYPWHRSGSLNNDSRGTAVASSALWKKKEANLLFSYNTEYLENFKNYGSIDAKIPLTGNTTVINYKLPKQDDSFSTDINYYPNVDTVLYNTNGYIIKNNMYNSYGFPKKLRRVYSPVSMKYLSTSHAILSFKSIMVEGHKRIPILPYVKSGEIEVGHFLHEEATTFWGDSVYFYPDYIDISNLFKHNNTHMPHNLLWLGELHKNVINRFGGTSKEALLANTWLVAGDSKYITVETEDGKPCIKLVWSDGDTFYQRYDCLKTYAFTKEDPNQIVEILSFMCESHVNLDGRYDKLRGQAENHVYDPTVFNRLNDVYNQQANFFVGKKQDVSDYGELKFPNQIYFTKTKISGADIDLWTNVTMGSTLELDGDKGELKKLARLGNYLWAFQDTGISQILYNENTQLSTKEGVPVEIANSGKVQGKRYLTSTVGCSNKWAFVPTSAGIYFIDSNEKSIYRFNGETLTPLSHQKGLNTWCKKNLDFSTGKWNPLWKKKVEDAYEDALAPMVAYYDKKNQDVLFINGSTALAYSEQFDTFTSFYDYGHSPYLIDFDGVGVWLGRSNSTGTETFYMWEHQAGEYCDFFDKKKPYWLTLVGNPDMIYDKIFTNLEFKAIVDTDGTSNDKTFDFHLPFDYLEVWNEYQHGISYLKQMRGYQAMLHHWKDSTESLKRKFRTWYCDIPRDNASIEEDAGLNISRSTPKPLNRIRNPWAYIKLMKEVSDDKAFNRTEIHDIELTYYV